MGMGPTSAAVGLVAAFSVGWLVSSPGALNLEPADTTHREARTALGATVLLLIGQVVIANGDLWVVAARSRRTWAATPPSRSSDGSCSSWDGRS